MSTPNSPTANRQGKRSSWTSMIKNCCRDPSEATDDERDFGDISQGATESLPLSTPAPFQTTSAKWSGFGRSAVTIPLDAAGTELSRLRHPSKSEPTATAARQPRQVHTGSRPDSRELPPKIEGSQQASTAAPSTPVQLTRVPSLLDPNLYRQLSVGDSTRTAKLPTRTARVPRNRRGSGASIPTRPHTETSTTGLQSATMITDRPDSEVLGENIRFDGGGSGAQGERPKTGPLGRESNKQMSFGDYFGNEPASPLPIDSKLGSLQRSAANLSQYAIPDRSGRLPRSTNLSATPSPSGNTPRLPSPVRPGTPPSKSTRI